MPDPTTVINSAASHSWEAALIALVLVSCMFGFGWLMKYWIAKAGENEREAMKAWQQELDRAAAREDRMAQRIDALETFAHTTLTAMVQKTQEVMDRVIATLEAMAKQLAENPCLWEEEKQKEFIKRLRGGRAEA